MRFTLSFVTGLPLGLGQLESVLFSFSLSNCLYYLKNKMNILKSLSLPY